MSNETIDPEVVDIPTDLPEDDETFDEEAEPVLPEPAHFQDNGIDNSEDA